LNQLIAASTAGLHWGLSFTYAGFGNRTAQTLTPTSSLTINPANNRITSSGFTYEANGNLKTLPYGTGTMTLTYDIEERLERASNSNGTEPYGYDYLNRRVYSKTAKGRGVQS
jgi:hypothetical protein